MRTRKYLIGALVAAVGSLALASTSSAAVQGQTYSATAAPVKQDRNIRRGVSFNNIIDTVYGGGANAGPGQPCNPFTGAGCNFFPPAFRTILGFSKDFRFFPGRLQQCNLASIAGQTTAGATAVCGRAKVGGGSTIVRTLSGGTLTGVVTAFNGQRSGGNPTILLHVDLGAFVATKPILVGTLTGNTLTVNIPVTPGTVIQNFTTLVNKIRTGFRTKKTGRAHSSKHKKRIPRFYVEARCRSGSWTHSETTTFTTGESRTAQTTQACKTKGQKGQKRK